MFIILLWSVCVFFVQQKTAYEMRISDWSSDVCSSDLSRNVSSMTTQANSNPTTRARTEGTNTRSKRSVNRWVGDFCVSASLTILTTLASVVSAARRVTAISIAPGPLMVPANRSEEHTSELQSLMRISYAVFCLKKKKTQ